MMALIMLIVIGTVVAFMIPHAIAQSRKADQAWTNAAEQLGLQARPTGFMQSRGIEGTLNGHRVLVDTYTVRSGKNNSTTYTRFRVNFTPLQLGLRLSEEGFIAGVTKLFGAQDIQVGDSRFDAAIVIKGNDPNRVKEFLTSARRMRIHRFFANQRGGVIDDSEIQCREHGVIRDTNHLVHVVRSMTGLASSLTGQEDDQALQGALHAQELGDTDQALHLLQRHREQRRHGEEAFDPDEAMLEGELLHMAGRQQESQKVFELAHAAAPDDKEIKQWFEGKVDPSDDGSVSLLALPEINADSETNTERGANAQLGEAPSDGPGAICQELFESRLSSFQITRKFDEQFAGQTVRWSGELRRVDPYSYDLVFGEGPGCRAVITIASLGSTTYGDQTVSAIVQHPASEAETLRGQIGKQVTFTGKLCKVDGLMRNLFLSAASE